MKTLKIAAGLLLLVVSLFVISGFLTYGEMMYSYYPSYQDIIKDGAVKRGWFLANFPASATEIYELHNLDSNRQWILFKADDSDIAKFIEHMEPFEIDSYDETALIIPEEPKPFKRYKTLDTTKIAQAFYGIREQDFNDYYFLRMKHYLVKLNTDEHSYYYWTAAHNMIPRQGLKP